MTASRKKTSEALLADRPSNPGEIIASEWSGTGCASTDWHAFLIPGLSILGLWLAYYVLLQMDF